MSSPVNKNKRLLVVTPAFNEESVIVSTLQNLKLIENPRNWSIDLLIIDDGSTDRTYELCCANGFKTIRHPFNCGVGVALRTGFKWAKENNIDALIQIDADGQHPSQSIDSLLTKLEDENLDIVIGSRFLNGFYEVSKVRRLAMQFLAFLVSKGTKNKITDATSGFRVSGRRAIEFFAEKYPGEYLGDTVESLVLAHHEGLSIAEIPAKLEQRQGGVPSHLSVRSALHVFRVVVMVCLILIRPKTRSESH